MSNSDERMEVASTKPAKRKTAAEIRHIHKEQQRIAREGSAETQEGAHAYLQQWEEERDAWKFNKAKQNWIIRHLYVATQIPEPQFAIALKYFSVLTGKLRDSLLKEARLVRDPVTADSPELQQLRSKALGVLPSHVTKAQANSIKKARREARIAKALKESESGAAAKEEEEDDGDKEESAVAVSETVTKRAERMIEVLTSPPENTNDEGKSKKDKKDKKDKKRKHKDEDGCTDGDSERKKSKKSKKESK